MHYVQIVWIFCKPIYPTKSVAKLPFSYNNIKQFYHGFVLHYNIKLIFNT